MHQRNLLKSCLSVDAAVDERRRRITPCTALNCLVIKPLQLKGKSYTIIHKYGCRERENHDVLYIEGPYISTRHW